MIAYMANLFQETPSQELMMIRVSILLSANVIRNELLVIFVFIRTPTSFRHTSLEGYG